MGCCSSSKSIALSVSPTNPTKIPENDVGSIQNTELVDHHQLQQQYNTNQGQSETSEDELPSSFANNKSIMKEVMRLEEMEIHKDQNNMEIKSNENSEDVQLDANDYNQSFAEFAHHTLNSDPTSPQHHTKHAALNTSIDMEDSYHPFGLIQTQNQEEIQSDKITDNESYEGEENRTNKGNQDGMLHFEALYAENLKQHGFDADKFRTANISMTMQNDTKQKSLSVDLSSFASSQMSSQTTHKSENINDKENKNEMNIYHDMNNGNEFITEEDSDEDFMMEELSKSALNPKFGEETDDDDNVGYIESFRDSVRESHEINNVMDDQDEELMDAILSLDLDD